MARRRVKSTISFLSGTYTEFLGKKPLPQAFHNRPILFLLGPAGSGKTMVARSLLGKETLRFIQKEVLQLLATRILLRKWRTDLLEVPNLIVEIPCFLEQRPQVMQFLSELFLLRADRGVRTAVLDSEDNASLQSLLERIDSAKRATLLLRIPEGRGRYRFLAHVCRQKGLPLRHARTLAQVHPWTYKRVFVALEDLEQELKETRSLIPDIESKLHEESPPLA